MVTELILARQIGHEGNVVLRPKIHHVAEGILGLDQGFWPKKALGWASFFNVVAKIVAKVGMRIVYVDLEGVFLPLALGKIDLALTSRAEQVKNAKLLAARRYDLIFLILMLNNFYSCGCPTCTCNFRKNKKIENFSKIFGHICFWFV